MLIPPRGRRAAKKVDEGSTASDAPNIKRPRGRPMKRASELKLPSRIQRQQEMLLRQKLTAEMADTRQPYELSPLEALPVELIQQIFFHALEVNMPRASSHIASVLSDPSIYSALILFAYFDSDDESPVEHSFSYLHSTGKSAWGTRSVYSEPFWVVGGATSIF